MAREREGTQTRQRSVSRMQSETVWVWMMEMSFTLVEADCFFEFRQWHVDRRRDRAQRHLVRLAHI